MDKSRDKFKGGYLTFRKYENKASVYVFFLFMAVIIVAGLFYAVPDACDKVYFIGFLMLVLVVLVSWLGAWVKKRSQDIHRKR